MEIPSLDGSLPGDFQGIVRLFPLPNLVMFPSVVQALHIFEPRYCDMLKEALENDKLIAMALLDSGWELNYSGNPPIADVVCIGKVVTYAPTDDDRHNILLAGIKRAHILKEIPSNTAFRQAQVEILEDYYPKTEEADRNACRGELLHLLHETSGGGLAKESLSQLFSRQVPLGVIADIVAYSSRLPLVLKQQLLSQINVDQRCHVLIRHMRTLLTIPSKMDAKDQEQEPPRPQFPPPFSNN